MRLNSVTALVRRINDQKDSAMFTSIHCGPGWASDLEGFSEILGKEVSIDQTLGHESVVLKAEDGSTLKIM